MRTSSRGRVVLWVGVGGVAIWTLLPFAVMLWASLLQESELIEGLVHWPHHMQLSNYKALLGLQTIDAVFGGQTGAIGRGFINSVIVSIPVAVIGTAMAVLGGYAFGRYRFPFKSTLLFILLSTRVLPPIAIIIPYFVILSAVGLVGTQFGLIITYLTAVVPLLTWIMMGYFGGLPVDIERAARIDGCSRLGALWHVTIPLAAPGITAAFVISFLIAWNELLFGIVLTGGTSAQTLSPALLGLSPNMPSTQSVMTLFAAASMLAALPPLVLAMLAQGYITKLNIADPVTTQGD
jgi:multiple sugar transport system permease protein